MAGEGGYGGVGAGDSRRLMLMGTVDARTTVTVIPITHTSHTHAHLSRYSRVQTRIQSPHNQ